MKSISIIKELLLLMNEQGCAQLKLGDIEITVPNPMRKSLQSALEQHPSVTLPEHKVKMAAVDAELFPEDYPADGVELS